MAIRNLGEYLPDLPEFGNKGLLTAKNVIPASGTYQNLNSLGAASSALTARCQGAFSAQDTAGNTVNYAGDATKLYKLASTVFSDVSKVGGYTTNADESWEFEQYGTLVLATNFTDPIQSYDLASASAFSDLSATAPRARHLAVVGDFVMAGNVFDSLDGARPERVWWCPIDNPAGTWATSQTTQSDYQSIPNGGAVQKIIGYTKYGIVLTERQIERFTYIGTPAIFQRDTAEKNQGTQLPTSVAGTGPFIFYYGNGGFRAFNQASSQHIGNARVDKTFENDLDQSYQSRVTCAIDPLNKLYMLAYPGSGSSGGTPNKLIIYNWVEDRWSHAEMDLEVIFSGLSQGLTLEDLDAINASVDSLPFSLDSRAWTGGRIQLAAFNTDHKLSYFDSTVLASRFETGEFQAVPGRRAYIETVRPLSSGATPDVTMGTRDLQSDSVAYGSPATPNTNGEAEVYSESRYHRVRLDFSGAFTDAQGVEFEPQDAGSQ
jgi:hypothetical protein